MLYFSLVVSVIILYALWDVNYWIRTYFTVLSGRLYQSKCSSIKDVTTIYGICTFQDCDVWCQGVRMARLLRELDFARYHFYDRTGVYQRSRQLSTRSLQGSTMTLTMEPVAMFRPYKINTKLVYWDDRSLFFEHEVVTLLDGQVRMLLISRQYALGTDGYGTEALLRGFPGSTEIPECPDYIRHWLRGMKASSDVLKAVK